MTKHKIRFTAHFNLGPASDTMYMETSHFVQTDVL